MVRRRLAVSVSAVSVSSCPSEGFVISISVVISFASYRNQCIAGDTAQKAYVSYTKDLEAIPIPLECLTPATRHCGRLRPVRAGAHTKCAERTADGLIFRPDGAVDRMNLTG